MYEKCIVSGRRVCARFRLPAKNANIRRTPSARIESNSLLSSPPRRAFYEIWIFSIKLLLLDLRALEKFSHQSFTVRNVACVYKNMVFGNFREQIDLCAAFFLQINRIHRIHGIRKFTFRFNFAEFR